MCAAARGFGYRRERTISGSWVVLLRLVLGALWLQMGISKLVEPGFGGMEGIINTMAQGAHPAYRDFLIERVLPNLHTYAYLVTAGEIMVGISLLLGLLTPFGALVGMFLTLNYWIGLGWSQWLWTYPLLFATHLVILLSGAGRAASIDYLLANRYLRPPI